MAGTRTRASRRSAVAATSKDEKARPVPTPGSMAGAAVVHAKTGYTLNIESNNIVVRHTGELTLQEVEASRRAVAELATERHLTRILLDLSRATSGLAPVDIFELCSSQGFALPQGATVAVVYRPGQFPAEDARFAEAVTLNHGAPLRAFVDFEAAQQWLTRK